MSMSMAMRSMKLLSPRAVTTFVRQISTYRNRVPSAGDRVYVAMSSGVDSSTVAAMMKAQQKYDVRGVFMANWSSTSKCMESDWNDVQKVCQTIGIPCERVSFERDYWIEVFEPMIEMYKAGLTPNPDVGCNRHIKFGALYDYLTSKSYSGNWWLATGHYARVAESTNDGRVHLLRPKYLKKDQSYYLSSIDPKVLNRILFPLAAYTKPEIREMAAKHGLHTATKKDSQGLCFVSQSHNNFRDFLNEYVEKVPGDVVTEDGTVVGGHNGLWHATIGQRSSISMPQGDPRYRGSWFVSKKIPEKNQLVVVRGRDHPSLFSQGAHCDTFRWLSKPDSEMNPSELTVQYRSLHDPEPLKDLKMGADGRVTATFSSPRRAVAPGQYLVVYHDDRVLGSGIITSNIA